MVIRAPDSAAQARVRVDWAALIDDADQALEGADIDGDGLVEFLGGDVFGWLQGGGVDGGVEPEVDPAPAAVDRGAEAFQRRIVTNIKRS
jgi:hypothetical protein